MLVSRTPRREGRRERVLELVYSLQDRTLLWFSGS